MLTALLLTAALLGRLPLVEAALLAATWEVPLVAAPALGSLVVIARAQSHQGETPMVALHRTLATELRAGQSLRMALVAACETVVGLNLGRVVRLATAGRPLEEVASVLREVDPRLRPTAAALRVAAMTGGSAAAVFDALTAEAVDEEALKREQRSLSGPAILSVAIVGGFPALMVGWHVASGELSRILGWGPVGRVMVMVGVGLLASGLLWVLHLLHRARR
jgi:Flp pilus assembly protein TadB